MAKGGVIRRSDTGRLLRRINSIRTKIGEGIEAVVKRMIDGDPLEDGKWNAMSGTMEDAVTIGRTLLTLRRALANGIKKGMLSRKDGEVEIAVLGLGDKADNENDDVRG